MNVKRQDLICQLADKYGYTKSAAKDIIDAFSDIILDNLRNGNSITINKFGCFDLLKRNGAPYTDLQTGEQKISPDHWIPRFYPSSNMRAAVKMWEGDVNRGVM